MWGPLLQAVMVVRICWDFTWTREVRPQLMRLLRHPIRATESTKKSQWTTSRLERVMWARGRASMAPSTNHALPHRNEG